MSRILIVGCGKLGEPLGQQLCEQGHQVIGVKRTLNADDHAAIEWLAMDVTDSSHFNRLPPSVDAVIIILTPASRSPKGYEQIYQHGINRLLRHFDTSKPRPWILFVSATSVYGQQRGEWVDENSPTEPQQYNGKSLLAAEQAVLAFNPDSVIVRFSGIYGAARSRVIRKLETEQRIQQSPPLYSNRIHQEDCIAVLHFIASEKLHQQPLDAVYLASDHDCAEKFVVMSWLAERAGLVPPVAEIAAADAPQNKRCSNKRLVERGFTFRYHGYRDGYQAMLQDLSGDAG